MPAPSALSQTQHPDSVEDLNYVSHKIQELVGIFNKMNKSKGCIIRNIFFNADNGEMNCVLGNVVQVH